MKKRFNFFCRSILMIRFLRFAIVDASFVSSWNTARVVRTAPSKNSCRYITVSHKSTILRSTQKKSNIFATSTTKKDDDDNTSSIRSWLEEKELGHNVLNGIYDTVQNVRTRQMELLSNVEAIENEKEMISSLLPRGEFRESVGVANRLEMKINTLYKNNDCPRCWMQRKHCICSKCPTIMDQNLLPNINRLFVIVHHKEIGLTVDTAKLLYMAFPHTQCHVVVNGIEPTYQKSMALLQESFQTSMQQSKTNNGHSCFILFPSSDALTFSQLENEKKKRQLQQQQSNSIPSNSFTLDSYNSIQEEDAIHHDIHSEKIDETTDKHNNNNNKENGWDVVVIDGTWSQANRIHSKKYIPAEIPRVCLSDEAVQLLSINQDGHQLRRHVIPWRQISTLEATRLLFRDMHPQQQQQRQQQLVTDDIQAWDILDNYQVIAKASAKKQLGPPRIKET